MRLGYLGVPPIFAGFYEFIESLGGRVVFNEVRIGHHAVGTPFYHYYQYDYGSSEAAAPESRPVAPAGGKAKTREKAAR